ncbi:MAG: aromatic ring-hydroxylating dioxygenase subunit alpha [Alphaproteobacteria bacterium]|nr:aromatic ring-hydroxylating dioxygenase subunit alpha [Alphaproteobacteria bacterium]
MIISSNSSVNMTDVASYCGVRLPVEQATPLPNWCYTSDEFYALEVEHIFKKAWNYVGHASQIYTPGDFFTHEITGIPIVLVHGVDGVVRAFYNSCRHRGAPIAAGEGNCKRFTCPYHSWTYSTDGSLVATPQIEEDENLKRSALNLLPVRLERWHGFLFVTFDDAAETLMEWLGDLPENCAGYGPENLVCTRRVHWDVEANWKLHFENFNDSLHIPFIHGGTLNRQKVSGRKRSTHEEIRGQIINHFTEHEGSRGLIHGKTGFDPIETLSGRYTTGTFYPCILPGTMMGWTIDCMWIFELHPTGPRSMRVVGASFFPEPCTQRDDFHEIAESYYDRMDAILPEDNAAVEMQQNGLRVPVQAASKFTHMETLCHAFDNWIVDQVLAGAE